MTTQNSEEATGGRLVSYEVDCACSPSTGRRLRKLIGTAHPRSAVWECEHGRTWKWMCTWAGCGWSEIP